MQLTIGRKLGLGFLAVLMLMVISAGFAYVSVMNMRRSVEKLADQAFPTVTACDRMLNGLNHSVAALRGYMILGADPRWAELHLTGRRDAWQSIDLARGDLLRLLEGTADRDDQQNLQVIQENLQPLRESQQQVEEIAHTAENIPAEHLLLTRALPTGRTAIEAITAMIEAEAPLEADPERKELLKAMADFRSSFIASLANIQGYLLSADTAAKTDFEAQWAANMQSLQAIDERSQLLTDQQQARWEELQEVRRTFEPLPPEVFKLRDAPDWNQAAFLLDTRATPVATTVREGLERLRDNIIRRMQEDRESLDAASRAVVATLVTGTLLALLVGSLVAVLLSRRMVVAIRGLLDGVQKVAAGDLRGGSLGIHSQDEIGRLAEGFNQMVLSLRGVLSEATTTTEEVASASSEIATGAQQQVASLNETATSLNEITTTAEEFRSTMQEFADRTRAVQEAADETARRSADGCALTRESAARIEQVQANSRTAGISVLSLSEQVQRIGEITATVNEIAEQTKLLALNASIEAARAGEEGRGFAVVATQVRELANQSKEAAGRIESLIADTQTSMRDVAAKIEDGSRLSEDSTEVVRRVTGAFEEIAQAISQTREAMSQINTSARQQEQGITELVSSIAQIDSASKESLSAANQTQKSIVAIDQRMRGLSDSMARFRV